MNTSDHRGTRARLNRAITETLESRLLLSIAFAPAAPAAPTNRTDVALGTMNGFAPIEPFIRVNPLDPANILPQSHTGTRITTNGGATFAAISSFANPAGTNTFNGDTGLTFDAAGRCYWVNMAGTGTAGIAVSRINPATGSSFSTVAISNSNDDKPFIAADATASSAFANNVYVVWVRFSVSPAAVMFSRSTNLGVSFSAPVQLSAAAESFNWPATVGVAPNGDVYVAYHANGEGATVGRTLVRRSTDGGVTFAAATEAFAAGQSAMTYNVQTAPTTTTIPGTQFWTQGALEPWVLPDPARAGNVYVVTNDDPNNVYQNGDNADVVFARSTNNGAAWVRSTISSGPANSFQLFPTASIDRFGDIVVAWYDNRRGLTNGNARFKMDIMATYSVDGGLTWAPEFMVSDAANPFDPDPGAVNRFTGPPPTTRIGEYFGSDLFGNTAHLAWNGNTFSGGVPVNQQVWYGNFAIAGALTVNGDDSRVSNDTITLRTLAGNAAYFEVVVNGTRQYAGLKEGITGVTINSGGGTDTITIEDTSFPVTVDAGSGTDTVTIGETSVGVAVTIVPSSGDDVVTVNNDAVGTAAAIFPATITLGSLTIPAGGIATVTAATSSVLVTKALSITGTGTLDLTDNDMVFDYTGGTQLTNVVNLIKAARNGGLWNGSGITSSSAAASPAITTLGAIEGTDYPFGGTFDGVALDGGDVLVKYTHYGDTDFNGAVDGADYARSDAKFNQQVVSGNIGGWFNGDFDYNGKVDGSDYALIDAAFNSQGAPLRPRLAGGSTAISTGMARSMVLTTRSSTRTSTNKARPAEPRFLSRSVP